MKRVMLLCLILAASVGGSAACGGGDADGPGLENDGTMSAMINDTVPWTANLSVNATLNATVLLIEGVERSGKLVRLNIRGVAVDPSDPETDHVFQFSYLNAATNGYAGYSESTSETFDTSAPGGTGTVTITRLTETRAEGTFAFVATRIAGETSGLHLGQGKFDVRIR